MDPCPLCAPRPDSNDQWDLVAKLSISSLYLARNQTYRGHAQLVFDPRHAARPDQLPMNEWHLFCVDLYKAQNAIVQAVHPNHINIESLGNVVAHLHWHIIPRYKADPRWGQPIWTTPLSAMRHTPLDPADRESLITQIRSNLAK